MIQACDFAEAQLKVFNDELTHLLRECSLRRESLENLTENRWVGKLVISSKHEEPVFLLDFTNYCVWVFLCRNFDINQLTKEYLLEMKLAGSVHSEALSAAVK